MSESIYYDTGAASIVNFAPPNNITIALALNGKLLTKVVTPDNEIAYGNAYLYRFFNRPVDTLSDIFALVKYLLARPHCCLIRGIAKYDDEEKRQRRLFHGADATIIEQNQNWYALDIDGYGECTGDLKRDAQTVLLALGLSNVEAFAIPSAGYMRKSGIRIRLFLWNSVRISCLSLKKHFSKYSSVVDTALFHPIQPIYIARPIFRGVSDPCKVLWRWISGSQMYTEIPNVYSSNDDRPEDKYTKKQAERFFNSILQETFAVEDNRHNWLYNKSIALGKWIWQDVLDEDTIVEELYMATSVWRGNRKKDMQTIVDGIKDGKLAMDGSR
jgi:hypothetical protein